ncbi:GNAT family N-acetyltransferase [Streptococcus mutans]|uniref:GNAT family N-acetyltransferase n=1 Tax=Streptococcus mutans TaxID=1309 RepID=UPI000309BECD|nr:GNAT family N-acetyltransferase [Streptococcus mutans]NLQ49001.1 GNAT family N-acetyltransferase [Streptococcus mutans]
MKINYTRDTLSSTYLDAVKIRNIVFVQGQGVPLTIEVDKNEAHCIHFVLYDDKNRAVATCRLLPTQDGITATLQRMAVLPGNRGKNYGKLILDAATDFAKNQGYRQMTLHAQLSAKGFYQRMQFKSLGQEFEEAGIKHITMTKAFS